MSIPTFEFEIPDSAAPLPEDPWDELEKKAKALFRRIIRDGVIVAALSTIIVLVLVNWMTIRTFTAEKYQQGKEEVVSWFPTATPVPTELPANYDFVRYIDLGEIVCGKTKFTLTWNSDYINLRFKVVCDGEHALVYTGYEFGDAPIEYELAADINVNDSAMLYSPQSSLCVVVDDLSRCSFDTWYVSWSYNDLILLQSNYYVTPTVEPTVIAAPVSIDNWTHWDCKTQNYVATGPKATDRTTITGSGGSMTTADSWDIRFNLDVVSDGQPFQIRFDMQGYSLWYNLEYPGDLPLPGYPHGWEFDFRGESLIAKLSNGDKIFIYVPWVPDGSPNYVLYTVEETFHDGGCYDYPYDE